MPILRDVRARIELTVAGRDTEAIPKVPDAGTVVNGVQVMHNGVRVLHGAYNGEWMSEVISRLGGHHEPQEELAFHGVLERLAATEPEPVMLELGAGWAYYSLWFLQRIPTGRAFLVEPDPGMIELGRRNFALNGRDGVFLQATVGAAPTGPEPFDCWSDHTVRPVPGESLPSVLDHFAIDTAHIVLADVQGAEVALLEGARDLLARGRVRFLLVSTHHHFISGDPLTHQRCLQLLRDLGAHVVAEHTVAESYSGDGLIVASFDPRDRDLEIPVSRARVGSTLFGDPLEDLAQAREELEAARAELTRAAGVFETVSAQLTVTHHQLTIAQQELAAVTATRTWRVRNRVLALLGRCRVRPDA